MLRGWGGLRFIQMLLGHAKIEATLRYVKVGRRPAEQVRSPLDEAMALDGE